MRKNLIALEIVGILLLSCFAITPAFGLSGSGKTLYVGSGEPGNYTTIQGAINDASDGDTVFVYHNSSPYCEHVVVDKSINLVGENKDTTIIDGDHTGDVVKISANWVNISGFTIQNSGSGYTNWDAGISILSPDSNNITIFGNNIANNNWGIFLNHTSNNAIYENYIFNNGDYGVLLNDSSSNIMGNIITNNNYGISVISSSNNNIYSNNIKSNWFGLELTHNSYNNLICNNNITENKGIGIEVWNLSDNNIISENNIISNGKVPVIGYGLVIYDSSNKNTIYHNNFIDNKLNASDSCGNVWDGGIWVNGYMSGGNYWDNYTGIDANHDGIGDTSYNISGGSNKDRYPLMKPFGENPPIADFTYKINKFTVTFTSVSYDRDGNVYVVDQGNHRIQIFKPNGTYVTEFGQSELKKPFPLGSILSIGLLPQ